MREANSRGGWGGQLGIEAENVRLVVEASGFPAQLDTWNGMPSSTFVFTAGMGVDYLMRLTNHRDGSLYLLAGLHLDSWTGRSESSFGSESEDSSHLGLRLGMGLRLGPLFGEVRYRLTHGDLRVRSSEYGQGGGWGAVEIGMGLRF